MDSITILLWAAALCQGVAGAYALLHTGVVTRTRVLVACCSAAMLALALAALAVSSPRFSLIALAAQTASGTVAVAYLLYQVHSASRSTTLALSLLDTPTAVGIIGTDPDGIVQHWSTGMETLLGYSAQEALGSRMLFGLCLPDPVEEEDPLSFLIRHVVQHRSTIARDLQAKRRGGERLWLQFTVSPQLDGEQRIIGTVIFAENITERIRLEQWLRDREANYKELADSISDLFFALDADARCTYWNHASERILGISERDAVGTDVTALFGQRSNTGIDQFCLRSLKTHEHSVFTADIEVGGEVRSYEISTYPTKSGISVFGRDVTWRKQAYDQLLYQSNILKNVLNSVIVTDLSGTITYSNHIAARTFGYQLEELRGQSPAVIYPGQDLRHFDPVYLQTTHGVEWMGEWEGRRKDGEPVWVDFKRTLMRNGEGEPIGVVDVSVDITERKLAQIHLQESEEKYRELGESISDIFFALDAAFCVTFWNKASEIITGVPRTLATGKALSEIVPPLSAESTLAQFRGVLQTRRPVTFQTGLVLAGRDLIFEVTAYPTGSGLSVFVKDVTERRKAEDAIESSLHEKEALLKEIHHRVKNNLQIISSLLSLQSQQIRNTKALEALSESQGRVRSMALIHEQLYQSRDLARIDFARYVRDLTAHLFRTYKTQGMRVRLVIEASNVFLDADQAIPCGMIINELVSNSLKHAFPGGREGTLRISTYREGEQSLRLTVEDNGKGIPENVDPAAAPSLGLKLVRMLTDQLRGSLEMQCQNGTSFTIRFSTKPVRRS